MVRTQVLLTPTLSEIVREMAIVEGKSISAIIRKLLTKALSLRRKEKTGADFLLELSKNAFEGGPKDLSTNDDYLYGLP